MKRSSIFTKRKLLLPLAVAGVVVTGGAFTFVNVLKPNVTNTTEELPQIKTESAKQEVKDEAIGQVQDIAIEQVQSAITDQASDEVGRNIGTETGQLISQEQQYNDNSAAKEQYLQSLEYAYELDANASEDETSFNVGLGEAYDAWDNELNKILWVVKGKAFNRTDGCFKKGRASMD